MTDEELKKEVATLGEMIETEKQIASERTNPILSKIEWMKKEDIMRVLNASYISERFFKRSKSWFSQRLNNNSVNGKPVEFTPDELEKLRNALYTISIEIQGLADEL